MLHFLMKDNIKEVKYSVESIFIQDGNGLFHSLIGLAPTFGDVSLQILSKMAQKQNFMFCTDSYYEDSIKWREVSHKGTGDHPIIDHLAIRISSDFKLFLSNDRSKEQLRHMLKKVWSSPEAFPQLLKCSTPILVVEGKAFSYKFSNMQIDVGEIFSLCSNQEESDTCFILDEHHAKMISFKNVVIRSPDMEMFLVLL